MRGEVQGLREGVRGMGIYDMDGLGYGGVRFGGGGGGGGMRFGDRVTKDPMAYTVFPPQAPRPSICTVLGLRASKLKSPDPHGAIHKPNLSPKLQTEVKPYIPDPQHPKRSSPKPQTLQFLKLSTR